MVVVRDRSGKIKLVTALLLVVVVAAVYYGQAFGSVYWRRMRFEDAVQQQLGFAGQLTNEAIVQRVRNAANGMGLPQAASNVRLVRSEARSLSIRIVYTEEVNLLFGVQPIRFVIEAGRSF